MFEYMVKLKSKTGDHESERWVMADSEKQAGLSARALANAEGLRSWDIAEVTKLPGVEDIA